jgi:hypothetical protein
MQRRPIAVSADIREVLLEIWVVNDRMYQLILEHLDPRAWRARLPGRTERTIAAIFADVHNLASLFRMGRYHSGARDANFS